MAAWPDLEELKQVLDVESEDWDGDDDGSRLTGLLHAAIDQVKIDIGRWDEYEDEPTDSQARAALRMAEVLALKPEITPTEAASDGIYLGYMKGQRVRWGGIG